MKKLSGLLLVCLCVSLAAGVASADDTAKKSAKLKYKAIDKFDIVLPKEVFTAVGGRIAIPHANGSGFPAVIEGTALVVDTNGDGKPEAKARGAKGNLVLKGKTPEGAKFKYAIRLINDGSWKYASSGAMVGKVAGVPVRLIDQNNNGSYADFGEDAMIVGKGKAAALLSRVVNCGGMLYEIDVAKDGREITYAPFQGESGTLDLASKFVSKGKLEAIVVSNTTGEYSFELSRAKKGIQVPADTYQIVSGLVTKGSEKVRVRAGRSKEIRVAPRYDAVFAWGGPIQADFQFDRNGTDVTFDPNRMWFFGKSGVEFYDWFPDGKPPKFIIRDSETGKELNQAKFGGC